VFAEIGMPDGAADRLAGTYRRFGELGPVYRVVGPVWRLPDGDLMLRVLLVESGEEAEYRLSHAAEDPPAT
jgi:uncharacterized protein DUF5397